MSLDVLSMEFRAHDSFDADNSLFFVLNQSQLLIAKNGSEVHTMSELTGMALGVPLFVGALEGKDYFSVELYKPQLDQNMVHIWSLLDRPIADFNLLGRALQLLTWDSEHQYCGRCGNLTERKDKEWSRMCGNCELSVYPRISPCVIMAVRKGEHIMLAQRPNSRHQMYSVLAGFIEPGESAEQAVCREVREEVGFEVSMPQYFDSQPWPFPGQIMIGYVAHYESGEFNPDIKEVANAGWFHYQNLPMHPPKTTIAGRLIRCVIEQIESENH